MAEVVAAIVGVVLGTVATLWISRYRPHHIVCEDAFRVRLAVGKNLGARSLSWTGTHKGLRALDVDIGVPYTEVRVKDTPVETLTVQRLKLRNVGQRLITDPEIQVRLDETAAILCCDVYVDFESPHPEADGISSASPEPPAPQQNVLCPTTIDRNQVTVVLKPLYPYKANRQVAILDIICAGDTNVPSVQGQGVFDDDQTVWSVRFEPWESSRVRIRRRVNLFNNISVLALSIATVAYIVFWHAPSEIVALDVSTAVRWLSDPITLTIIGLWLLFLGYAVYMGMRGWSFSLTIPLLRRRLVIYLARGRGKQD